MQNNTHLDNQPLSVQKTNNSTLMSLNNIINDKVSFIQKKNKRKKLKDIKKVQLNYGYYIRHHQQLPRILLFTFIFVQKIQSTQRRVKKQSFLLIRNIFKYNKVHEKDIVAFNLKAHILKETFQKIVIKKQYQQINNSFQKLRMFAQLSKKQESSLVLQKGGKQLENIRIFGYKCQEINKQLKLDQQHQQNSISDNILDQSVYLYHLDEQKVLFQRQLIKNLLIRLNQLQEQILKRQIEVRKNKQLIIEQIQHANRIIETQQNQDTIKDNYSSKQYQVMKQDGSFSHLTQPANRQILRELLQKNRLLQQQADHIRATIEHLLQDGRQCTDINPQLLAILQQVKKILEPSPLGLF